jgi:glutathione S-transferase
VITLYDAGRCPYCARVRIAFAEKGIEYETVEIDLRGSSRRIRSAACR